MECFVYLALAIFRNSAEAFNILKSVVKVFLTRYNKLIKILKRTIAKNIPQANDTLIVDDNSKDDTIKEIKTYSKKIRGTVKF